MPRKSRNLYDGKICHHIVQGINKEYIFNEDIDKIKYFKLLEKYYKEYAIDIICYCIMDNHAHIILYSDKIANISKFMRQVNQLYAIYYNKKYNRVGYVFRNRFKSILILTRKQLFTCIKYIHMNPVKAGIVRNECDYKYSSYNDFLNNSGFLNQRILDFLFLGSKDYIEKFKEIPYKDIFDNNIEIEKILNEFYEKENVKLNQIRQDKVALEKFIDYLVSKKYRYSKKKLADVLEIGRATLYRKIKKVKSKNGNN